ncbi:MAG: ABC transporter permease [Paraburkholderia sp.]|jgi:peptide/nickel transport system permease protein|uniref:ABC transporter permease n=1 Tax=Burkholderiaceae TaxID=119060 RepID=UPI0010F584EE|nr:ABC transporter permease [Burkholderia sp. 4M9327F10]
MSGHFWRRFSGSAQTRAGIAVLGVLVILALVAPCFGASPWNMVAAPLIDPLSQLAHPLGTDMLGRDVLTGLVWSTRASLSVGVAATAATLAIGVVIGALAGWFGGWIDDVLMRITELFQTIPQFALAVVVAAVLGASPNATVAAIAIASWPVVARVVRGEFLSLKQREFILAAHMIGQRPLAIVFRQLLPHALSPVAVLGSLMVGNAILTESALSFLGLGDPGLMSWGFMIGAARNMIREHWWLSVWPGLAIVVTVLAVNLVGEGLRQALAVSQPALRGGR